MILTGSKDFLLVVKIFYWGRFTTSKTVLSIFRPYLGASLQRLQLAFFIMPLSLVSTTISCV